MDDSVSLGEARGWLRERVDRGEHCPLCGQHSKVYKRKLNSGMARSLILMHKRGGSGWIHIPTELPARSREEGKLRYWGLIEESPVEREDGGRAGWWRVTSTGTRFVLGRSTVPKYARIYDDRLLRLDGEPIDIWDALGDKFDYDELMAQ